MDQTENRKKKNRYLPIIWLLGLGLAGGMVILSFLLAKKNQQLSAKEQELIQLTSTNEKEKLSLQEALDKTNNNYSLLQSEHEKLSENVGDLKNRNRLLNNKYQRIAANEQKCSNDYKALLNSLDLLRNENETLKSDLTNQHTKEELLKTQLSGRDSILASNNDLIKNQQHKIQTDSLTYQAKIDTMILENTSRFINITELNGAYGLYIRSIPYSHYFYGITNVSGLFVNKHFISGIGLGVLKYDEALTVPLYLDFRYHFAKRNFTPYLYADGGLVFQLNDMKEPMLFINPGVGVYKTISEKFALNFGAGFFIQRDVMAKASFINFKLGLIYIKGGQ